MEIDFLFGEMFKIIEILIKKGFRNQLLRQKKRGAAYHSSSSIKIFVCFSRRFIERQSFASYAKQDRQDW